MYASLKYFLAYKIYLHACKVGNLDEEIYFRNKMEDSKWGSLLEEEKSQMKEKFLQKESLKGIIDTGRSHDYNLFGVIYYDLILATSEDSCDKFSCNNRDYYCLY